MKPPINLFSAKAGKTGFIMLLVLITFSCSKSSDTNPGTGNTALHYCGNITWTNNADQSASYTGSDHNGVYGLDNYQYTESGNKGGFPLHYDSNNHLISDQQGVTYTYNADTLSRISINFPGELVSGSYNFSGKGHFTFGEIDFEEPNTSGTLTGTYTYDTNDDPVHISAVGTLSTANGPMDTDIEIDGSFLTDKQGFLPFIPVFAPASSLLSIVPFLSKHLLDKWDFTLTGNVAGMPVYHHEIIQYSYTFNSDGYVATLTRSDNSFAYTFTYSDCQ